jgi:hypothetical protein
MDAVVAKEDPIAVSSLGVAGEVRTSGRSDLCTPASAGIPCREALPMAGLRTPMPRSWVRHTEGGVTVRERLSATIELTVPSQDGRLRTPGDSKRGGDITAASPGVLGVIVPVNGAAAAWCLRQLS